MKTLNYFLSIILLASCSTAYKSGQTPDDVYYSKAKTVIENANRYEHTEKVYEEREIRMAAYDYRWRTLNDNYDYNYNYSPYNYGYNYGYYYNPYYCSYPVYANNVVFVNPKNTTTRTTNLNSYNNNISTYTPIKTGGYTRTTSVRGYNNNNSQTIRSTNSDTRTYTQPRSETRTYSPSQSNGSSNSNSSTPSQGTSVPMPGRGGN